MHNCAAVTHFQRFPDTLLDYAQEVCFISDHGGTRSD
jgi:hypothetical protein